MKTLIQDLRSSIMATIVFAVGVLWPISSRGLCAVSMAFNDKANGSLIVDAAGVVHGSHCSASNSPVINILIRGHPLRAMAMTPQFRRQQSWPDFAKIE